MAGRLGNQRVLATPPMNVTIHLALYGRAQEMYEEALEMRDSAENKWTPVIAIALETLLKDPQLHHM